MIEEWTLRRLAGWRVDSVMTSFYLDVDGRRYPRPSDYAPHVAELFRIARAGAEAKGKQAAAAVEADLSRLESWLAGGVDRSSTRGIVAFANVSQGRFEAFGLPVAVRDQVVVGSSPDVAQLCMVLAASTPALVVVVDRYRSRLVRLGLGEIEDRPAPTDETPRQVDTNVELGSFERRHEELAREHYRRVARAVTDELRARPVRWIVVGGPGDEPSRLQAHLSSDVRALEAGRLADAMQLGSAQLAAAADEVVREAERRRRATVIAELANRAEQAAGAVAGLGPTLELLGADRVSTLVVEEGCEARGGRCPRCGELVPEGLRCPRCGARPEPVENVVDAAVVDAFSRQVTLEVCEKGELAALGGIGALERFGQETGETRRRGRA